MATDPSSKQLDSLRAALPAKGRVLIVPHDYPDPDALAAAAAVELLLKHRFGLSGQIVFTGIVSRAENREMLRHFRYKWRLLNQMKVPRRNVPCIFVDTAPWSGNVTVPSFAKPVAVFDHHPAVRQTGLPQNVFLDIREGAGATATLLHETLREADVTIPKWLATVMLYAIATETQDLSRDCTPADVAAYVDLVTKANMAMLGRIRNAPLQRSYFGLLQQAMSNAYTCGRVAWTHLDGVKQPEFVAETADLLLRAERITWSFCTACHQDTLLVSLRSSHPNAQCGRMVRQAIGRSGSGGGHRQMAAGSVNLSGLSATEREKRRQDLVAALLARIERRARRNGGAQREARRLVEPPPPTPES